MFEILDENLNIRVMNLETEPNAYYISLKGLTKVIIDVKYINEDVLFNLSLQDECNINEVNIILDKFSDYFFNKNEEVNGIILKLDPNELLDSIGFKEKDSKFLYRERNRKIKR